MHVFESQCICAGRTEWERGGGVASYMLIGLNLIR